MAPWTKWKGGPSLVVTLIYLRIALSGHLQTVIRRGGGGAGGAGARATGEPLCQERQPIPPASCKVLHYFLVISVLHFILVFFAGLSGCLELDSCWIHISMMESWQIEKTRRTPCKRTDWTWSCIDHPITEWNTETSRNVVVNQYTMSGNIWVRCQMSFVCVICIMR